ncbi:MAG TPA: DUF4440 domain-containing protein [Pyrinomonadaceae bacterium]
MSKARLFLVWAICFCCIEAYAQETKTSVAPVPAMQKPSSVASVEREVRGFYDSYAEDLRQHRNEAIANRYDPRGVFLLGNGKKALKTFEEVRNHYVTKWKGPKAFEWKDLTVEVLSPVAAVVLGRFEWQTTSGETLSFSYTGVLVRQPGGWRIRVEDESTEPPKPAAQ